MRPKPEDEFLIIKAMQYFKAHAETAMNLAYSYNRSEYEAVMALDPETLVRNMK